MKYQIADLIVEYEPKFDLLREHSEKYVITNDKKAIDIKINITDEQIKKIERNYSQRLYKNRPIVELIEYLEVGKEFYKKILDYNGCLLHSSAIVLENNAYLFSAPSKTGKSTHTRIMDEIFNKQKSIYYK